MISTIFLQKREFIDALYIVAFTLFIIGLRMLRHPKSAVQGNYVAAVGMVVAVGATLLTPGVGNWGLIIVGVVLGTVVGVPAAKSVKMTAIPQMVALFNGVGGGAVALIALTEFRGAVGEQNLSIGLDQIVPGLSNQDLSILVPGNALPTDQIIPLVFAAIVGTISFWGSIVAFAKLQELISGRPIKFPGSQLLNAGLAVAVVACGIALAAGSTSEELFWLLLVLTAALGVLVVLPIGGADMPVVISTLNAFTGLSAAAAGIALDNTALIVAGMLVGASGSILTKQMADAMNRSLANVFFGGFGSAGGVVAAAADGEEQKSVRSTTASDVAIQLSYARLVILVPGYGMAVAQAQRAVADLSGALQDRGVQVISAIHPVAGRMPGHMNVLLAEADVPYEQLKEMDDVNPEFAQCDVALVIGANDVTNPAARNVPDSPIYGMPILDVDKAHSTIILKRSMGSGFAGIDNPLFYDPKTAILFGDAKESVSSILAEVNAL